MEGPLAHEGPLLEFVFCHTTGAYAKGVGSTRAGILETTFEEETDLNPEKEDSWLEWYDYHHLMLCRLPGWTWSYRYIAIWGPEKYLSVYRVESDDVFKHIEAWPRPEQGLTSEGELNPLMVQDFQEKVRRNIQDTSKYTFGGAPPTEQGSSSGHWGWRHLAGAPLDNPLLTSNRPIGTELVSIPHTHDGEWKEWYGSSRFPALLKLPGVVMGAWFGIKTDGRKEEPRYNYCTIFEIEDEGTALLLGDPSQRSPEARTFWEDPSAKPYYQLARDVRFNYYKPISKHYSFEK